MNLLFQLLKNEEFLNKDKNEIFTKTDVDNRIKNLKEIYP